MHAGDHLPEMTAQNNVDPTNSWSHGPERGSRMLELNITTGDKGREGGQVIFCCATAASLSIVLKVSSGIPPSVLISLPTHLIVGEILVLEGQIVKNHVIVKEKAPNLEEQGKQDLDKILKEQGEQDLDQILEEQGEQDLDQALQMEVAVLPHTLSQHAIRQIEGREREHFT